MTEAIYKLVGFDRQTEREAVSHVVPWHLAQAILKLAEVDAREPLVGSLELTPPRAREIAAMLHCDIDTSTMDFCLESYAAPARYGLHTRV